MTGVGRFLAAGACAFAASLLMPIGASAHAFLVQTSPAAGQRLLTSPPALTLQFSEAVAPGGIQVTLRNARGELVKTPAPSRASGGDLVDVRLPVLPPDVYEVQWQVVSADDAHASAGSFAFGVGTKANIPAATQAAAQPTDSLQAAARFLFLVSLAFAAGLLVNVAWVWRAAGFAEPSDSRLVLGIPLAAAALGAGTQLGLFLWRLRSGGDSVFASTPWQAFLQSPAGRNELIALVSVLIAGGIVLVRGARRLVLLPLALAAVAAALTTHPASARAWWGLPAITVHVLLTLLWFGMLAHLVVVIARRRFALPRTTVLPAVRRYAQLALWSAAGVLVTGLLAALAVFSSPAQLITTSYGKLLLLKMGMVLVALLAAAAMRLRSLRGTGDERIGMIRGLTRVEAALLLGVFALSSLLGAVVQPSLASTAVAAIPALGPPPPNGPAIDLAGQAGWWEVYLAASKGQLTVIAVSPGSTPPPDLSLSLMRRDPTAGWSPLGATACGVGCLAAPVEWTVGVTDLEVQVSSHPWPGGKIDFSVPWPPVAGDRGLLADVIKRMQDEPKLSVDELVTSGPGATGHGVYTMPGSTFLQGEPYGADTGILEALPEREGLKTLVVFLPGSQIWVQLSIDKSQRLRAETIVDPGHLIERSFSYP
jgi:copper transport protein